MRALALTEFGTAPRLIDLDTPEPGEGEVRVRVHAASVNGFDLAVANGYLNGLMEHRFPVVLGKDFAGTVDALGPGAEGYRVGDRVFGVVTKPYLGDGSLGEYVTVPTTVGLAHLPDGLDFVEGASIGLAGAAALACVDAADLGPGRSVLVVGATGGVGTQVIQLAALTGAKVLATASTEDEQNLVTALGAARAVDHTGDLAAAVREQDPDGVDVVVHLAGDPGAALAALREGGRFVSTMIGSPDQVSAEGVSVVAVYANPDAVTLERAATHQAEGTTRVVVQRTYDLGQAAEALADFSAGTLGKLVVTI